MDLYQKYNFNYTMINLSTKRNYNSLKSFFRPVKNNTAELVILDKYRHLGVYTIQKRFMQKGVGKGVFDKVMEKCIGAGCNSTRPHMPPIENKSVNNPIESNNNIRNTPKSQVPVSSTPTIKKPHDILPPFMKKDLQSVKDIKNEVNFVASNTVSTLPQEESKNISTTTTLFNALDNNTLESSASSVSISLLVNENIIPTTIPVAPPQPKIKVIENLKVSENSNNNNVEVNKPPINFAEELRIKTSKITLTASTAITTIETDLDEKRKRILKTEFEINSFKNQYKEELNLPGWNKTKDELYGSLISYYKIINDIIDVPEMRSIEEANKIKLLAFSNLTSKLAAHLDKEIFSTCYILDHYLKEAERLQELKVILETSGAEIPDVILHELVRRAGITINNDVMPDGIDIHERIFEGQGASLHHDAYTIMKKNPNKYYTEILKPLNQTFLDDIFQQVKQKNFQGVIIDPQYFIEFENQNKIIDSGDEVHMHIVVKQKHEGVTRYFSVMTYTSTKDNDTIALTKKQYIAAGKDITLKEQLCRPLDTIIEIPEHMIKKPITDYEKMIDLQLQTFTHNTNCEGKDIPEILQNLILKKEAQLRFNKARELLIINKQKLIALSIDKCEQNKHEVLEQHSNLEKELKHCDEMQRKKILQERENQYKNYLKKQKEVAVLRCMPKELAKDYRELQDIKKRNKKQK